MKKLLFLVVMLALVGMLMSSTVYPFIEDFNGVTTPTGWTLTNVTHSVSAENLGVGGSRCLVAVLTNQSFTVSTPSLVNLPTGAVFRFQYRIVDPAGDAISIGAHVIEVRAGVEVIHTINATTHATPSATFRLVQVNVPAALIGNNAVFSIVGLAGASDNIRFLLDDVGIVYRDMTAVRLVGPSVFAVGDVLSYDFTVRNTGGFIPGPGFTPANYAVQVREQGTNATATLFSQTIAIELGQEHTFTIPWTVGTWPDPANITSIHGFVNLTQDVNIADNRTSDMPVRVFPRGLRVVNVGDPASTARSHLVPVATSANASFSQTIYRAGDMGVAGDILSISYRFTGTGDLDDPAWIQILMANVPNTAFTGTTPITNMSLFTEVFNDEIMIQHAGTRDIFITLDKSFRYTGQSLVVMVNKESSFGDVDAASVWHMTELSDGNRVVYETGTNTFNLDNFASSVVSPSALTDIPNTIFVFDTPVQPLPYFVNFNASTAIPNFWQVTGMSVVAGAMGQPNPGINNSNALRGTLDTWTESFSGTTSRIGEIPAGAFLRFYYRIGTQASAAQQIGDHVIQVRIGETVLHTIDTVSHTFSTDFAMVALSLEEFEDEIISVNWRGTRGTSTPIDFWLDDVHVFVPEEVDMAISRLHGPTFTAKGAEVKHTVRVYNMGSIATNAYTVELRAVGQSTPLAIGLPTTIQTFEYGLIEFTWTPQTEGFINIYARLNYGTKQEETSLVEVFITPQGSTAAYVGNPLSALVQNDIPVPTRFTHGLTQMLYLEDEIGFQGSIDRLIYRYVGPNNDLLIEPFSVVIYMATTDKTLLAAGADWINYIEFEEVFSGTLDLRATVITQNIDIRLTSSYNYTGGNLVIMIHSNSDNPTFGFAGASWVVSPVTNRSLGITDTAPIDPSDLSGLFMISRTNLPNTVFVFNDNDGGGSLNVVLSNFNARANSVGASSTPSVSINWVTASENNMRGFHILRNDIEDSRTATEITLDLISATNTSTTQNYSFVDNNVSIDNTYFYWLVMINRDGSSSLSHSRSVSIEGEIIPELPTITTMSNVYPNPMKSGSVASFDISVKENETANLQIFNIRGQLVHEVKNIRPGNRRINWNGLDRNNREVASGIYFYSLTSPSMHDVRRMVIVK